MRATKRLKARRELTKDFFLIFVGAGVAWALSQSGLIGGLVRLLGDSVIASFISGLFFTSVFTVAPASVALAQVGQEASAMTVALWGALGAMCGDLLLFYFIRDRFAEDLLNSLKPSVVKHIFSSFHFGFLKWLSPLVGAFIIASPLPDEMGLALMGMSKVKTAVLMPVSFVMNAVGIYAVIWFAHLI